MIVVSEVEKERDCDVNFQESRKQEVRKQPEVNSISVFSFFVVDLVAVVDSKKIKKEAEG